MEHLDNALWLSRQALAYPIVLPTRIVFILAAISFVWAAIRQQPFRTRLWKPHYWLVVTHLLFFAFAIAVGVFCADPGASSTIPHPAAPLAGRYYLDAVAYGSYASCGFWIWRMKGLRWFATSLMAMAELITFGALFVAGMSITGDWL